MAQEQKEFDYNMRIFEEARTDWRAITSALILTAVIHAILFFAIPDNFFFRPPIHNINELELEILPPQLEKLAAPSLPEYVEANPDANMDKPLTENPQESFQDQRAAEETPDPESKDTRPHTEGELKESEKIVSGSLDEHDSARAGEKVFETLERPLERPSDGRADSPSPTQVPLPSLPSQSVGITQESKKPAESDTGKDAQSGSPTTQGIDDQEGPKASPIFAEKLEIAGPAEELAKDKEELEKSQVDESPVAQMDLPKPRARPSLTMRTPPGPLADSNTRTSSTGVVAVDSRFSEFGAYQQRMVEAVSRQWHLLASRYDLGSATNSQVTVEFFLDHQGEITSFNVIFNTSTLTGKSLCEQAILSTAPYGPWTAEMRNIFGDQDQSVKFNFYYR